MSNKTKPPAVVFGLFETALGVARSLGQNGVYVIGVDFKKDITWYSRYVKPLICPHPLRNEADFITWVQSNFREYQKPLPVFLTSDDFLLVFSRNREILEKFFTFNLADRALLDRIFDKYQQYLLAESAGVDVPRTFLVRDAADFDQLHSKAITFPLFIKGLDVNLWRKKISGSIKGFQVGTKDELTEKLIYFQEQAVPVVVQSVIIGPDTNHCKYSVYMAQDKRILGEFMLQKLRQNPIRFGVGSLVQSIHDPELLAAGRRLFQNIGYAGIGSAEFKRDNRDGKLKLIEINPRYWQQNYLTTACGLNLAYMNYLDLLGHQTDVDTGYRVGMKWVNRYMEFDSFVKYRNLGELTFREWRKSLQGPKVYADFTWDDPVPALYEIGFGRKLVRAPWFLCKRIFR